MFSLVVLVVSAILLSHIIIKQSVQGQTYDTPADIPKNRVGVVLGTAPYLKSGGQNPYFVYRIDAVVALYAADKIDYILVSGDNGTHQYNEPEAFRRELVKRGIPNEHIFLDYAGFRTLDSVVRAKAVFGLSEFTIISQQFHNERALFIAKQNGINAIGYNARNLPSHLGFKTQMREYLARTKVFIDLIFNVKPKFFGEKVTIGDSGQQAGDSH
ncbi:MAG: ElyC/SanA/YdcF family protein [Capnocytophaga sp.]|nr:ElyC/SanA/YdcF family protein [Capnocytophaga sp.]